MSKGIETKLYTMREYKLTPEGVANAIKLYLEEKENAIFSDDHNVKVLDNGTAIVQIRHPNTTKD